MKIAAVKLYENGFMSQPFAFGGEEGPGNFDPSVTYRSSLQNFVIDTGSEVILVDTGMPDGIPDAAPDKTTPIYMGTRIEDYLDALRDRLEYSETMMYGDLLIYMLYTYFEGIKQLMAMYSDETVSQKKLFWYFRKRAIEVYVKYHKELSGYQKRDYIKLILSPSRYRKIVLKQIKEKN